jgi:hypothetical protein
LGSQGELRPPGEPTTGLPPRDLTGLLQETFHVYKRNFWPFFLIFLAPQVPSIIFSMVPGQDSWTAVALALVLLFALYPLVAGASVCAVAQQYVQGTADPGFCYRRAWYRVVTLGVSNVVFVLALFGAIVTIVGIPLFFFLVVIWFFFWECIMLDGSGPMAALWRSRDLVRGSYWRILGIGLVYTLVLVGLVMVALVVSGFFTYFGTFVASVVGGVLTAMAGPVLSIGRTLVYLDLRVRKEGYTMDDLARDLGS